MDTMTDEEREEYSRLVQVCKSKGYKPGWAAFRFKDKFGHFPPEESRDSFDGYDPPPRKERKDACPTCNRPFGGRGAA